MRWTDLPPDPGPADDGASPVPRRGDWEDLRRRLERLPPGHPSAPDGDGEADERADGRGEPDAGQDGPEPGRGRAARPAGRGGSDARSSPAAGGQREPYRPWFTAGETPEPWFYADSEG
jgi:hypothetical protein